MGVSTPAERYSAAAGVTGKTTGKWGHKKEGPGFLWLAVS